MADIKNLKADGGVMCRGCRMIVQVNSAAGVTVGPMPHGCWNGQVGLRIPDVHAYCDKWYEQERQCPAAREEIAADKALAEAKVSKALSDSGVVVATEIQWLPVEKAGYVGPARLAGSLPEHVEVRQIHVAADGDKFALVCKSPEDGGEWLPIVQVRVPVKVEKKSVAVADLNYSIVASEGKDAAETAGQVEVLETGREWEAASGCGGAEGFEGPVMIVEPDGSRTVLEHALLQWIDGVEDKYFVRAWGDDRWLDMPGWTDVDKIWVSLPVSGPAEDAVAVAVAAAVAVGDIVNEVIPDGNALHDAAVRAEQPKDDETRAKPLAEPLAKPLSLIEQILGEEVRGEGLGKPDVGDVLARMPGYAGGSSLASGLNIHILADWLQCPRRVYLAYVMGLRHRYPQQRFQIGTLVHAGLQFAKTYGLDRWEDPLRHVEQYCGAGVVGEEMAIARACLRTRLEKYGHLDHGPHNEVICSEQKIEALTPTVSIKGLGRRRVRMVGRLDDARKGTRDSDGAVGTVIQDEKTAAYLTTELTQGFGLDFQGMGYGAIFRHGGYEQSEQFPGPLAQFQVTIMVKPTVPAGGSVPKRISPDSVIRVASDYLPGVLEDMWENQLVPAAVGLASALVQWQKEAIRSKERLTVNNHWPKCVVNCVGRWGRCDFFEMCSAGLCGVAGLEHRFRVSEEHQIDVVRRGNPYFEKASGVISAPRVSKAGDGTEGKKSDDGGKPGSVSGPEPGFVPGSEPGSEPVAAASQRDIKEAAARGIAYNMCLTLKAAQEALADARSEDVPVWVDSAAEEDLEELFGTQGQGLDGGRVKKLCESLLKTIRDQVLAGTRDKPIPCNPEVIGDGQLITFILHKLRAAPNAVESQWNEGKTALIPVKGARWYSVPANMIVPEMVKMLTVGFDS